MGRCLGSTRERSERPPVTLNLCVMRRYDLGEGDLVSTAASYTKRMCQSNFK